MGRIIRPSWPFVLTEGDGAIYAKGSRATRGLTVLITDETGRPVEGATVSFSLPADGPSGEFSSGGQDGNCDYACRRPRGGVGHAMEPDLRTV